MANEGSGLNETRLSLLRDYNPGRLMISRPSLDKILQAENFLSRKAQVYEERDLRAAPVYLDEVVASLTQRSTPSRKAMRRVAAGGLPDLLRRPDGPGLFARFIEAVVAYGSRTIFKALLLGYLRIGHEDSSISEALRSTIFKNKDQLPKRWTERVDKFGLLEKPVATKLATMAMSADYTHPLQAFEEAGLKRGVLLGGGFAARAFALICEDVSAGHDVDKVNRFLSFFPISFNDSGDDPKVQLTKTALPVVAKALLKPYLESDPSEEIRGEILEVLVRLYRDPRLNAAQWSGVDQDLLSVLFRWLTSESFEMLMEVLNSSNQSAQWRSREAFWRGYIKRDFVKEAWIAFGPDAEKQARKLIRDGQLRSRGSFGVLEHSQIQGHHSVLFMRIGDLTISEWTHDGKVRFYRSRNEFKPALYQLRYDPEVLRRDSRADYFKWHKGYWQFDVSEYVREVTGLKVSR
jgi:hypothetical protein